MKLADIRSETRVTIIGFAAGDLKVTYRPNAFTADVADRINSAVADPKQQTDAMFQMVSEVLVEWDLEGDDGQVIAVTDAARLRAEVPMQVFGRIFAGIQEDQDPGKAAARS